MKKMNKRMTMLTMAVAIMLFAGGLAMLNAKASCGQYHDWVRGHGVSPVRKYTHSHYTTKNGRLDYWPCIVYDLIETDKIYCIECGHIKSEVENGRILEERHELAY